MSAKKITYEQEAREAIRKGVRKLAHVVKVTLGPRGRNVILNKSFGPPKVTKDGVTVAKEIDLEDPHENVGAQMVKEVARKTGDDAARTPHPAGGQRARRTVCHACRKFTAKQAS